MADRAIESRRCDVRPSLFVFIAGSAALHAALLGFMPGFIEERQSAVKVGALEVLLGSPAEPPTVARDPDVEPAQSPRTKQAVAQNLQKREKAAAAALPESPTRTEDVLPGSSEARTEPDRAPDAAAAHTSKPLVAVAAEKSVPAVHTVANAAYLDRPAPRYPETARHMGQEGTVMVRVLVTADGAAAQVALERTSGSPHLDRAALERVRNWRFRPARLGSAPVESWFLVPIVFRLESAS